jgi:translation initiation factor IF-3
LESTKPFLVVDTSKFTVTQLVDDQNVFHQKVETQKALELAKQVGLDLVCFALNEQNPLCKLMDYGKWKYHNDKRRKQKVSKKHEIKEIRFSPVIHDNDINHKIKHIEEFIEDGHEINLTMRVKKRQNVNLARERMNDIVSRCEEFASVTMRKHDQKFFMVRIAKKKKEKEEKEK